MKAMILAAGEGRRMRPLTDSVPKPLLPVGGTPLIVWHIRRLRDAGFTELVINVSHLGDQIINTLGDGEQFGVKIVFSREVHPLETAGGIAQALPLLGEEPFLLINSDVWTDYPLQDLRRKLPQSEGAHLILVNNPEHHVAGDFSLDGRNLVSQDKTRTCFTYSGISIIQPQLIRAYPRKRERFALLEVLEWAIEREQVSGELYGGDWLDVGTPERLNQINRLINLR